MKEKEEREIAEQMALFIQHGHSLATERKRVAKLLQNASLGEVIEFAKLYQEWRHRIYPGVHVENSRIAQPGDLVYERTQFYKNRREAIDKDIKPREPDVLVFIASVRKKGSDMSTRLCVRFKDKKLVQAVNIGKLSELPGLRFLLGYEPGI